MPDLPHIPGRSIVAGATKRARALAADVGAGAVAAGGFVLRRVLGHRGDAEKRVDADPIAATSTAPPGAEDKPIPRPKPAPEAPKPKAGKPDGGKSKPAKPKSGKPPKPKGDKRKAPSKPPAPKPESESKPAPKPKAPPKPPAEPGNISGDKEPHHALSNPVVDPDETEYPDPFEKREDPLDPVDPDGAPFGEEPHSPTGAESTSEPNPRQDIEAGDRAVPPKRDKLDE